MTCRRPWHAASAASPTLPTRRSPGQTARRLRRHSRSRGGTACPCNASCWRGCVRSRRTLSRSSAPAGQRQSAIPQPCLISATRALRTCAPRSPPRPDDDPAQPRGQRSHLRTFSAAHNTRRNSMSFTSGQPGAGPSRRGFISAVGASAALSSIPELRSPGTFTAAKAGPAGEPAADAVLTAERRNFLQVGQRLRVDRLQGHVPGYPAAGRRRVRHQ